MHKERSMRLGMVGLGRMGANMTRRLCAADTKLVVTDLSAEAVEALGRRRRNRLDFAR